MRKIVDIIKKIESSICGKGGWKCYCCGPKDKKEKRIIRKKVRTKFKFNKKMLTAEFLDI